MQDLRFCEVQNNSNINNNIRSNFNQSTSHNSSHVANRLDSTLLDPSRNRNNFFGIIGQSHKQFDNGSGSSSVRNPVQNGPNGLMQHGETDLTYYDWPSIDNFEDIDQLFGNSDSTFGQSEMMDVDGEETEKEQLSWFNNSSDAIYTSEMEVLNNDLSAYPSSDRNPDGSDTSAIKDTHKWRQNQEDESVEEIMKELIDEKCSLADPSEQKFSPFGPNQSLQLESDPSSYVTFNNSYSVPPVETARQNLSSVAGKAPLQNRKFHLERGSDEQKGMMDSSEEETSFRQLKNVMNQLDEKTKLCIRDSLYRLARSFQQRTNCYNGDSQFSPNFVELSHESDTNPVDRTIAELLFHHPSSNEDGSMSLKSSISASYYVNT